MDKLRAYVIGATGLVGQRYVQLLAQHPWFELAGVAASPRSAGRKYREVNWVLEAPMPEPAADLVIEKLDVERVPKVDVVFSALPSEVAAQVEPELAKRGHLVVSNSSNMRLDPDVPLVIPEVNPEDLGLVRTQRERRGWSGAVIKKPNCSTTILGLPLKPVMDEFGVVRVHVTTIQAVTGAGYSGVSSVSIIDNLIPFIKGEEEKIINETQKIFKKNIEIYATTTRAPVLDGHTEVVYVETERDFDVGAVADAMAKFRGPPQELKLPMAPPEPIVVAKAVDRPQPRLDRMAGGGMSVVVGRIRKLGAKRLGFVVLGHNTIRGAAGNAILAAEMYVKSFLR
ncbi:MAG: aspartate-semialdehyde dehydrogenase [Thermoproteus sp.]|nr:aspartate-semialdehyde dehydrogenase [Thermoproteus sp.]